MNMVRLVCCTLIFLTGCTPKHAMERGSDVIDLEAIAQLSEDGRAAILLIADSAAAELDLDSDLDSFERVILEDAVSYQVLYILKDPYVLGGGAAIHISKTDLQVTRIQIYQ